MHFFMLKISTLPHGFGVITQSYQSSLLIKASKNAPKTASYLRKHAVEKVFGGAPPLAGSISASEDEAEPQ